MKKNTAQPMQLARMLDDSAEIKNFKLETSISRIFLHLLTTDLTNFTFQVKSVSFLSSLLFYIEENNHSTVSNIPWFFGFYITEKENNSTKTISDGYNNAPKVSRKFHE